MTHNNIIFAMDDPSSAAYLHLRDRFRVNATGALISCTGSWEGITERSYLCTRADFDKIVVPSGHVMDQVCVLAVSSCNKMYAQLEYPCGKIEQIGCMHHVTREEALASIGYTYRPDVKSYWVAKAGNPDNSYRESVARTEAGFYNVPAIAAE